MFLVQLHLIPKVIIIINNTNICDKICLLVDSSGKYGFHLSERDGFTSHLRGSTLPKPTRSSVLWPLGQQKQSRQGLSSHNYSDNLLALP